MGVSTNLPLEGTQLLHHAVQQRHHRVDGREAAQGLLQLRHHHADVARLPVDVLLSGSEPLVQSLVRNLAPQYRGSGLSGPVTTALYIITANGKPGNTKQLNTSITIRQIKDKY